MLCWIDKTERVQTNNRKVSELEHARIHKRIIIRINLHKPSNIQFIFVI